MTDREYEQLIDQLGNLREHARQLAENDYVTALYKGYSASGQTLAEINEEISATETAIQQLERQIENDEVSYD
ncbi:hypothetical protein [Loigolactobacillus jiayinensis]|uniref:Uncharacterized protein n=1 Tax=Loigolactobacillus jiayinensis TaxID=2486016 RepID=A0ABW1RGE6_9LACO|nr:hypothetical protein [Loigolactobacillus jiayinensis]